MPYHDSLLCYIACVLYSTGQGVICIRCYIASYMATTKVPDDAAGGKAFRRFLAYFCCFLFFPLGFKFCCIVLRVANARDLIIDLRRLCYLQWITTQTDSENSVVFRV